MRRLTGTSKVSLTEYIIDPQNQREGWHTLTIGDSGRIVHCRPTESVGVPNYCVVPAGVDMHSHVVSEGIHAARVVSGDGLVPALRDLPALYHRIGYTTVVDAAVSPEEVGLVRQWIGALPTLNVGFLVVAGDHPTVAEPIRRRSVAGVRDALRELLAASGAWGIKVVNPSAAGRTPLANLHDPGPLGVSPAEHIRLLAEAIDQMNIAHPMHIHGLDLGIPGNIATTMAMLQAIEGIPVHLAHAQFHVYREVDGQIRSGAEELADWVNTHPEVSLDLGQVIFGPTVTVSADLYLQARLRATHGGRWGVWRGSSGGIAAVPYRYRRANLTNAIQWAVGLELALLVSNPWQVFISVDHPNGGSFRSYPAIIQWLTSAESRLAVVEQLPKKVQQILDLPHMTREYTDREIVVSSSAGPARRLGLVSNGHLGEAAEADAAAYALYNGHVDWSQPQWVIKNGQRVWTANEP